MQNREEALDFIYKGFRDGRMQARNMRRQRGLDRTRAMYSPILAQRARGSMASMPPSMPVEETRVPEGGSPMAEITETVSSPPSAQPPVEEQTLPPTMPTPPVPENDFSNDITDPNDHPDDFSSFSTGNPMPMQYSINRKTGDKMIIASDPLPTSEEFAVQHPGHEVVSEAEYKDYEKTQPQFDEVKQEQHSKAFETAFEGMKGETPSTPDPPKPKKPKPKEKPKPDEVVAETAKKTIKPQEEESKKPESDSGINVRPLRLADKNPPKYGRFVESGKGVVGSILHTEAKEKGLTRVMMPGNKIAYMVGTPKPDKEVVETAKKNIKPKKKATERGKSAVRAASDRLARSGMMGDTKDESPEE